MTAAFDCAPGRASADAPHVWAGRLESTLSVASASPRHEHAEDLRQLLRRVPPAGLLPEWRALVDSARAWLAQVDARPVPHFSDLAALNAAAACRPTREHGWQRAQRAICGE